MKAVKSIFILNFILVTYNCLAQKEFHFYSDQPEIKRFKIISNDFSYSTTQIQNDLFLNLKISLTKKTSNISKPITFSILLLQNKKIIEEQAFTDVFYNYDGNFYYYKIPIKVLGIDTASIKISNQNPEIIGNTDISFFFRSDRDQKDKIYLYDQDLKPILEDKFIEKQSIVPVSKNKEIFVRFWEINSRIANHPISGSYSPYQYRMKQFKIKSETPIILEETGYYLLSTDSSFSNPKTIRVTDINFPKFNTVKKLYEVTTYLKDSTNKVIGEATKQDLDNFWLTIVGSKNKAKGIIKGYYNRVFQANSLFTQKCIGWKTDMGMTYIILGEPNSTNTDGIKTIWKYEKLNQEFIFSKDSEGEFYFADYNKCFSMLKDGIAILKKGEINE